MPPNRVEKCRRIGWKNAAGDGKITVGILCPETSGSEKLRDVSFALKKFGQWPIGKREMMANGQNNDIEIDLIDYFKECVRKWWLILAIIVVCAGIGFLIAKATYVPYYESTATIYILPEDQVSAGQTGVASYTKLPLDCATAVTMHSILEGAIEDAGLTGLENADGLKGRVTATVVKDTSLINITVKDLDANNAKLLADAIAENSVEFISGKMKAADPQFIEESRVPTVTIGSKANKNAVIGAVLGFLISLIIIFFIEYVKAYRKSMQ